MTSPPAWRGGVDCGTIRRNELLEILSVPIQPPTGRRGANVGDAGEAGFLVFHGSVLRLNLGTILPDGAQHFGAIVLFNEDLALPVGAGRHIGGFRGGVGFPGEERGPARLSSVAEGPEHTDFHWFRC